MLDELLYNIRLDGSRSLYIPYGMVKDRLESAHEKKYLFKHPNSN